MICLFLLFYILASLSASVVGHDSDYDGIPTTPSCSFERIKSKAQEARFHGTGTYRKDIDFIKLKKRHMFYGTKVFEDRWTPGFEFLNSSEFFKQEGNTPRSPAQVVRDKEKFLADNPDYKNEKVQCYEELMKDKNIFLDNYDIVKYRKMVRDQNLDVTVDWNRFRKYTNTTYPPEDPLSNELHRIHNEMFRTKGPLQQLEALIRRKAELYQEEKRRENMTRHREDKAVSYRYVRRPKVNCTYLYGKADIIDSGEYIKQLIDRRPRDPENSEDPDFIKYCLNRGYNFGFDEATTFKLRRNFTIPHFNLNREKVLDLLKSSEIDLEEKPEEDLDHTIDEDAVRAQYSNEVDALKKLKSLEAKRVEKLMKQVKKLKSKLKTTTTEKSVWMDHPLFLNRMFDHKAIVDRCMGENCTMVPTTIDFYNLYQMHRNTRTTDVSLLSREILRGQDTLQASQFEKYLHFMRKHRNNSALSGQDILDDELRARNPKVFQFVQNSVEYTVNNSHEVMNLVKEYEENQARELSSVELNHTTEPSIWDHWETPGSTTEDPARLKMEVLYKEPPSYNFDSHPWHNTSDEVDLLWKKHKKEMSPDYSYETAFPVITRSTARTTTHRPAPWQEFLAKLATIDRLDRRLSDVTTPEYQDQHARVKEYDASGSQLIRVHEIGFKSNEKGPDTNFDERALVDEVRYDEANKAHLADQSNVVKLDASHGASYMDLDPEEAIALPSSRPSSPALKWRAITRRTEPTTPEPPQTKPVWFIKSSQRYHQRLQDRKRWEIEKLRRTPKSNVSTRLPVGMLHEDDLYYDEAAMPAFDLSKARQQLHGTTSSYEVGTFENLPYVEKKNVMRASIKRQRALNEYWSRKFSMTTLPTTRRTWNFLAVSSARYYWGAMRNTFVVHFMNSSEAYEDDKRNFYNKLGLYKSTKSKTTAGAVTSAAVSTQSGKAKKTKTKKTKAPTTVGSTKSTTSFPIPLNGSYEEWRRWNENVKEENNIISWYSDTSERVWAFKKNRSLYTPRPIERSGVYYESGSDDYPVNCSLSLETDVPEAAEQWKQFENWQKDRFTRLDLTFESLEEPPYEKLPIDMRTTLDSRAHQITHQPRVTSPKFFEDSSEEWDKLNLAIPRRTRPPRNGTARERRAVGADQIETAIAPSIFEIPLRKLYSGGYIAVDRDTQHQRTVKKDIPTDSSENGLKMTTETTERNVDHPTLLNLERLVNYLERLNRKSSPETVTPKERVVLDNLKQLFAFLEAEHVKSNATKNSGVKSEERSYGQTELHKMRGECKSIANRLGRVEFKNNIMEMPAMKELKNQLLNKTNELSEEVDSNERKLVKKLTVEKLKKKDLVHTLENLFHLISAQKMSESKYKQIIQAHNQDIKQSSSSPSNEGILNSLSSESKEYNEIKTNASTVSNLIKDRATIGVNVMRALDRIEYNPTEEEIHYDEDSKQLDNQFPLNHFNLNYSSDDFVRTEPSSKITFIGLLLKMYESIINLIRAIIFCLDSAVKEFEAIKCDVSSKCAALNQKSQRLVNSIYFYLRLQERVINLIGYIKLQETNSTVVRLHQLRKQIYYGNNVPPLSVSEENNQLQMDRLKPKRLRRSNREKKASLSPSLWRKVLERLRNGPNRPKRRRMWKMTTDKDMPYLEIPSANELNQERENINEPNTGPHMKILRNLFLNIKYSLKFEHKRRNVEMSYWLQTKQKIVDLNYPGVFKSKHKVAKRDVVYTYSDESTINPDDQWYIDLAAREFVQGRDKNDPNYNRSKFMNNLKRSGIFSFGNFSQECLSNKTWPTVKPPTTWSRNFSIRYQPCTFWNWTRYLQVHSSYMDFLFGTGTPLTTKKRKRNLTAKRMRAHQDFLNRFSPKTTLKWPSSIWFNTTDWSAMESYADQVLKIKGITDREPEDYFTLNSELRRISSIVWEQTETTEHEVRKKTKKPNLRETNSTGEARNSNPLVDESSEETRVHKKRKKKPNRPEDSRSKTDKSDVYYDEMERHSTTEHIPDWEYADNMFRHWRRIKD